MELIPKNHHPSLSIVIPCYNDHKALNKNLPYLLNFLKELELKWEIIIVDDGSQHPNLIKGIAKEFNATYLQHFENLGKGAALRTGVLHSRGDVVMYTDSDIPYEMSSLLQAYRLIQFGQSDIAIGSRHLTHTKGPHVSPPLIRRLANKVFANIVQHLTQLPYQDTQCGFKVFTQQTAKKLFSKARSKGFVIDIELLILADLFDYRIKELPVCLRSNDGQSVQLWYHSFKMLKGVHNIRKKYKKSLAG